MPTIFDNGIETPITDDEARKLLAADVIYPNTVGPWDYSVTPDYEDDYANCVGSFSILAQGRTA